MNAPVPPASPSALSVRARVLMVVLGVFEMAIFVALSLALVGLAHWVPLFGPALGRLNQSTLTGLLFVAFIIASALHVALILGDRKRPKT